MIQPVSFELAKVLKEKGFDKETKSRYYEWKDKSRMPDFNLPFYKNSIRDKQLVSEFKYTTTDEIGFSESHVQVTFSNWNNKGDAIYNLYSAPSIAEVIIWLYEKHDIWIEVSYDRGYKEFHIILDRKKLTFKTPVEAYETAIWHYLNILI